MLRARARSSSRPLAALMIAGLVLLAGCTTQSTPDGYGDGVRADFVAGCRDTRADANAPEAEATELCTRIYEEIAAEVPFEQFKEDNSDLQEDAAALPDRYTEIISRCESVLAQPEDDRPDRACGE